MSDSVNIGHIRKCESKSYMEWAIPNYFSIQKDKNYCIESPSFSFCNEMWYLVIYPCGQNITDYAGWVGIYLKKQYPTGFKQNVNFKIGIKRFGGAKDESYKGTTISEKTLCWGSPKLCEQSSLINEESTIAPHNILTVFCTLQINKSLLISCLQETSSIKEKNIGIGRVSEFNPPIDVDTVIQGGVSTNVATKLQCIAVMKEFKNKSLEELRLEYYGCDPQRIKALQLKLDANRNSGFSAATASASASSRRTVRAPRRIAKRTVGDIEKKANLSGVSTSDFKFGSHFEIKPLTGIATSNNRFTVNEMTESFKQFSFESTSGQNHDKSVSSETQDNRPSFTSGISSQKSGTFDFGNTMPWKYLFGGTEATNEDEIVHKTVKDFEMVDYDKEKDVSEGLVKLSEDLKEFYVNGDDTDLIFKVQDKEFKVHKSIIMARSPVFATMLRHDMVEKNHGFVTITDCDSDIFQEFLLYLYTGKAEKMSSNIVTSLYQVADKYDVQLLKSLCVRFMVCNLCVENFCDILSLALRFKESAVIESATCFFAKNIKNIIVTIQWLNFQKANPVEANELHIKALN